MVEGFLFVYSPPMSEQSADFRAKPVVAIDSREISAMENFMVVFYPREREKKRVTEGEE